MIGNDVVDIVQSRKESNWQRKGFIQKIFTPAEQLLIMQAADPEIMVWLLWSMKEAAYKIYNRKTKIREFIPQKLSCTIFSQNNNGSTGQVMCSDTIYHTQTTLNNNVIHTIAVINIKDFSNVIEVSNKNIVKDEYDIPYLYNGIKQDVSVSHHGYFEKVVIINDVLV